jgi:plastocyanin
MYTALVRSLHSALPYLSLAIGCSPATHDQQTLDALRRLDERLARIEQRLAEPPHAAAQPPAAEPRPPLPPIVPVYNNAPEPVKPAAASIDPAEAAPPPVTAPTRGVLTGSVRVTGPYATLFASSIIALAPASGNARPRRSSNYSIEQSQKSFQPHLLAVPVGSKVSFPNHDVFFHNVFSLQPQFDLGVFNVGESRDVRFDRPGVVQVLCNLHANMAAFLVVLDEPYFAVTNERGHFTIKDLPPGRYHARAWHELSKAGATRDIVIAAGDNHLELTVSADTAPTVPPDKHGRARQAHP